MASVNVDTWTAVLQKVRDAIGEQRFALWFSSVQPVAWTDRIITLGVPNLFVQEWFERHLRDTLREALREVQGAAPEIVFQIAPALFQEGRTRELETGAEVVAAGASLRKGVPEGLIRPDFTLDTLVVGPHNKLCVACAREILESGANRMSPLFIHSQAGMGKTHLLQAIWHEFQKREHDRTAVYVSAEAFTNQFIYAMRTRRLDGFRHRYRHADVLMIDDVDFFRRKSSLQEELLHTFDALDMAQRQIVLAGDVHPKMLTQVRQSLINRFASGMIVKIGKPDYTTRLAILKARAERIGRRVPEAVLRHIARSFEGSVRELIGALTTVLACSTLTGERPSLALAKEALAESGSGHGRGSAIEMIEKAVGRQWGVEASAWHGRHLTRSLRLARQVCMYLARQCANMSCREVARHFGSSNHSNVLFAVKRIEEAMKRDQKLAALVAAAMEEIRGE